MTRVRSLHEFLQLLQLFAFVGLGLAALVQWRRTRSEAAAWLAASFGSLGAIVIVSRFLPEHSDDPVVEWIEKVDLAVLVFFPYFLWRFATTFIEPSRWLARAALGVTVLLSLWALALPALPEEGEERSAAFSAYVLVLLIQWVALSGWVAVQLWRAGRGQPTVARRRMRTLSLGSIGLALALVIAGAAPTGEDVSATQIVTQILALLSGPFFLMGFAPPGLVRLAWRRPEEEALREAEFGLMKAEQPSDVADVLLPHVARLVGGDTAALFDEKGNVVAAYDPTGRDPLVALEAGPRVTKVELASGHLSVAASPFSPFFGREEQILFRELALLADLALARVDLLEALQRSNAELEQFAYVASHDLQEPLRTVASYAELLSKKLDSQLDDKGRRYVHYVVDGCSRMQNLINDLLDFSRVGTRGREFEPTDLKDVLEEARTNLRAAIAESGAAIEAGGLPVVAGDRNQLTLVVQNLLSNSIKFAGEGPPSVVISAERDDAEWLISFEDRGIGIDPRYADRIFTIFQRLHTRDEYPGTGIGLAICKKIIERHGGRMWLDSEARQGSRFLFTLPTIEEVAGDGSSR